MSALCAVQCVAGNTVFSRTAQPCITLRRVHLLHWEMPQLILLELCLPEIWLTIVSGACKSACTGLCACVEAKGVTQTFTASLFRHADWLALFRDTHICDRKNNATYQMLSVFSDSVETSVRWEIMLAFSSQCIMILRAKFIEDYSVGDFCDTWWQYDSMIRYNFVAPLPAKLTKHACMVCFLQYLSNCQQMSSVFSITGHKLLLHMLSCPGLVISTDANIRPFSMQLSSFIFHVVSICLHFHLSAVYLYLCVHKPVSCIECLCSLSTVWNVSSRAFVSWHLYVFVCICPCLVSSGVSLLLCCVFKILTTATE